MDDHSIKLAPLPDQNIFPKIPDFSGLYSNSPGAGYVASQKALLYEDTFTNKDRGTMGHFTAQQLEAMYPAAPERNPLATLGKFDPNPWHASASGKPKFGTYDLNLIDPVGSAGSFSNGFLGMGQGQQGGQEMWDMGLNAMGTWPSRYLNYLVAVPTGWLSALTGMNLMPGPAATTGEGHYAWQDQPAYWSAIVGMTEDQLREQAKIEAGKASAYPDQIAEQLFAVYKKDRDSITGISSGNENIDYLAKKHLSVIMDMYKNGARNVEGGVGWSFSGNAMEEFAQTLQFLAGEAQYTFDTAVAQLPFVGTAIASWNDPVGADVEAMWLKLSPDLRSNIFRTVNYQSMAVNVVATWPLLSGMGTVVASLGRGAKIADSIAAGVKVGEAGSQMMKEAPVMMTARNSVMSLLDTDALNMGQKIMYQGPTALGIKAPWIFKGYNQTLDMAARIAEVSLVPMVAHFALKIASPAYAQGIGQKIDASDAVGQLHMAALVDNIGLFGGGFFGLNRIVGWTRSGALFRPITGVAEFGPIVTHGLGNEVTSDIEKVFAVIDETGKAVPQARGVSRFAPMKVSVAISGMGNWLKTSAVETAEAMAAGLHADTKNIADLAERVKKANEWLERVGNPTRMTKEAEHLVNVINEARRPLSIQELFSHSEDDWKRLQSASETVQALENEISRYFNMTNGRVAWTQRLAAIGQTEYTVAAFKQYFAETAKRLGWEGDVEKLAIGDDLEKAQKYANAISSYEYHMLEALKRDAAVKSADGITEHPDHYYIARGNHLWSDVALDMRGSIDALAAVKGDAWTVAKAKWDAKTAVAAQPGATRGQKAAATRAKNAFEKLPPPSIAIPLRSEAEIAAMIEKYINQSPEASKWYLKSGWAKRGVKASEVGTTPAALADFRDWLDHALPLLDQRHTGWTAGPDTAGLPINQLSVKMHDEGDHFAIAYKSKRNLTTDVPATATDAVRVTREVPDGYSLDFQEVPALLYNSVGSGGGLYYITLDREATIMRGIRADDAILPETRTITNDVQPEVFVEANPDEVILAAREMGRKRLAVNPLDAEAQKLIEDSLEFQQARSDLQSEIIGPPGMPGRDDTLGIFDPNDRMQWNSWVANDPNLGSSALQMYEDVRVRYQNLRNDVVKLTPSYRSTEGPKTYVPIVSDADAALHYLRQLRTAHGLADGTITWEAAWDEIAKDWERTVSGGANNARGHYPDNLTYFMMNDVLGTNVPRTLSTRISEAPVMGAPRRAYEAYLKLRNYMFEATDHFNMPFDDMLKLDISKIDRVQVAARKDLTDFTKETGVKGGKGFDSNIYGMKPEDVWLVDLRAKAKNIGDVDGPVHPLGRIMYHGSSAIYEAFDPARIGDRGTGLAGPGVYLTESPPVAHGYSTTPPGLGPGDISDPVIYSVMIPSNLKLIDTEHFPQSVADDIMSVWNDYKAKGILPSEIDDLASMESFLQDVVKKSYINALDSSNFANDEALKTFFNDALEGLGWDGLTHYGGGIWGGNNGIHEVNVIFDPSKLTIVGRKRSAMPDMDMASELYATGFDPTIPNMNFEEAHGGQDINAIRARSTFPFGAANMPAGKLDMDLDVMSKFAPGGEVYFSGRVGDMMSMLFNDQHGRGGSSAVTFSKFPMFKTKAEAIAEWTNSRDGVIVTFDSGLLAGKIDPADSNILISMMNDDTAYQSAMKTIEFDPATVYARDPLNMESTHAGNDTGVYGNGLQTSWEWFLQDWADAATEVGYTQFSNHAVRVAPGPATEPSFSITRPDRLMGDDFDVPRIPDVGVPQSLHDTPQAWSEPVEDVTAPGEYRYVEHVYREYKNPTTGEMEQAILDAPFLDYPLSPMQINLGNRTLIGRKIDSVFKAWHSWRMDSHQNAQAQRLFSGTYEGMTPGQIDSLIYRTRQMGYREAWAPAKFMPELPLTAQATASLRADEVQTLAEGIFGKGEYLNKITGKMEKPNYSEILVDAFRQAYSLNLASALMSKLYTMPGKIGQYSILAGAYLVPMMRYKASLVFRASELVESRAFNMMRHVTTDDATLDWYMKSGLVPSKDLLREQLSSESMSQGLASVPHDPSTTSGPRVVSMDEITGSYRLEKAIRMAQDESADWRHNFVAGIKDPDPYKKLQAVKLEVQLMRQKFPGLLKTSMPEKIPLLGDQTMYDFMSNTLHIPDEKMLEFIVTDRMKMQSWLNGNIPFEDLMEHAFKWEGGGKIPAGSNDNLVKADLSPDYYYTIAAHGSDFESFMMKGITGKTPSDRLMMTGAEMADGVFTSDLTMIRAKAAGEWDRVFGTTYGAKRDLTPADLEFYAADGKWHPMSEASLRDPAPVMAKMRKIYASEDWQATEGLLKIAAIAAQREAFGVHYFGQARSTLERSINHPLLGMYPASWAYKAAKEWIRFLYDNKMFGDGALRLGMAPAVAIQSMTNRVQTYLAQSGVDPNWSSSGPLANYFFLFNLLMPGDWTNIPFPLSRTIRSVVRDLQNGTPPDPISMLSDNIFGPNNRGGIGGIRDVNLAITGTVDVWNAMTKGSAGSQYQNLINGMSLSGAKPSRINWTDLTDYPDPFSLR